MAKRDPKKFLIAIYIVAVFSFFLLGGGHSFSEDPAESSESGFDEIVSDPAVDQYFEKIMTYEECFRKDENELNSLMQGEKTEEAAATYNDIRSDMEFIADQMTKIVPPEEFAEYHKERTTLQACKINFYFADSYDEMAPARNNAIVCELKSMKELRRIMVTNNASQKETEGLDFEIVRLEKVLASLK